MEYSLFPIFFIVRLPQYPVVVVYSIRGRAGFDVATCKAPLISLSCIRRGSVSREIVNFFLQ